MNKQRFRRENLRNIQKGFYDKLESDAEYAPGVPAAQRRRISRRIIVAPAAAATVLFTLTLGAFAAGFDPIAAWQGLFEKETSIEVGEQLVSAGISMDVQSLYTDGERAVVKMTLKDTEGDRLSDNITISSKDTNDYFAYVETVSYDAETGEATCVVKLNFNRQYSEDEILRFAVDSIIADMSHTSEYQPFDFDLYGAAVASELHPTTPTEAWAASARANPAPGIQEEGLMPLRGGVAFNEDTGEFEPLNWLPLDPSAQGEKLCHWLSMTGIGYEDGVLHVQLRHDDLFGVKYQYAWDNNPALIDGEGNVIEDSEEILHRSYKELQFEVGDIENLKDLSLAWGGNYAENVFDGSWSYDINLDSVGNHISGEMALPEHPDYTNISYTLSSMYLETKIDFPVFSIPVETRYIEALGREVRGFGTEYFDDKLLSGEISIILKDGTRIDLPVDGDNLFDRYYNHQSGAASAKTQHWLDGSFEPGDVAEIIIFGVSLAV
jgi:hypothetical protein